MHEFTQDLTRALANAPLRHAFERRRADAGAALAHWMSSSQPDILALRRSLDRTDDIDPARRVADRLRAGAADVVVLGVGGSSLGAQTLVQLTGWGTPAAASATTRPRLHFLDNLDSTTLAALLGGLDLATTRFHVVSKSGGTAETQLQLLHVLGALEAAGLAASLGRHVTGEVEPGSSALRSLLGAIGALTLDHDPALGGRYTVFSTVGLVPAMLAGLDPLAIRAAGRDAFEAARRGDAPAIEGAALAVAARDAGLGQSVLWAYADRLERLTKWWRQLWAESLGKAGQGTTPVDALGPVDQHSQLQLYLDGPQDKLFTFLSAPPLRGQVASAAWASAHGLSHFAGRDIADVTTAQLQATMDTLAAHGRPVRHIALSAPPDERTLGTLLTHFILETLIAARLWNVDPFGQPAVEEGKRLTRQYLDRTP